VSCESSKVSGWGGVREGLLGGVPLSSLSSLPHPLSVPPIPPSQVFVCKVEVSRLGDIVVQDGGGGGRSGR
jgi:hypothetical protein